MGDEPVSGEEGAPVVPPVDPIVAAARQMVLEVFKTSAAQLPELLKAHPLPPSEIPAFTAEIIARMEAQLSRVLGPSPDDRRAS